jgi:hypothetical protein
MLSHSLEILSHEDYQEEIDASYIIPLLRKMHYIKLSKNLEKDSSVHPEGFQR